MEMHKFTDRKKELVALIIVGLIVVCVAIYVVYLVNGLTARVYKVFGRPPVTVDSSAHFDFAKFEELGLRPKKVVAPPVISPAPITPVVPATTTSASTSVPASPASSTRAATTSASSS